LGAEESGSGRGDLDRTMMGLPTDAEYAPRKHSGLGAASFVIAVLVLGFDLVLGVFIWSGIVNASTHQPDSEAPAFDGSTADAKLVALVGLLEMYCVNCMCIPLCLVGVGLAVAGLVAHRDRKHVLTWFGLFGNGAVIAGVIGFQLLSTALVHH
jgi:hypothetical protein